MSQRPTTADRRPRLEDFIAGKPLNEEMARLMRGEDDPEPDAGSQTPDARTYADGTPVTDIEREHLRRTLNGAGWQVLLKLLDTELQHQEDAARRISVDAMTPKENILAAWADVAADKKARNRLVAVVEAEVKRLAKKPRALSRESREKAE